MSITLSYITLHVKPFCVNTPWAERIWERTSTLRNMTRSIEAHVKRLQSCNLCPRMQKPVVTGQAVSSKVLLVGQAPGVKEPLFQKPFAWTAGKTLFKWFKESCAMEEDFFRSRVYMAAVCRCFPGKQPNGRGDRVPSSQEIDNCSRWLKAECDLLSPELVIPVGKLAIKQFMEDGSLSEIIGRKLRCRYDDHCFDLIPLPHPSGASPWPRIEPGKTLLKKALRLIAEHQAIRRLSQQ